MEQKSQEELDKDWDVVAGFMNVSDEDVSTCISPADLDKIESDATEFTSRPGYRERVNAARDRAMAKLRPDEDRLQ